MTESVHYTNLRTSDRNSNNTNDNYYEEDIGSTSDLNHPFRVLGIALVVDQKGTGASLVFRYPTAPPFSLECDGNDTHDNLDDVFQSSPSRSHTSRMHHHDKHPHHNNNNTKQSGDMDSLGDKNNSNAMDDNHPTDLDVEAKNDDSTDLFFRLSSRQMAKLFRPKPALCGQPMTLSIGGTVFVCGAVLMTPESDPNHTTTNHRTEHEGSDHPTTTTVSTHSSNNSSDLVLFSVVVALAPHQRSATTTITGWYEPGSSPRHLNATELSASTELLRRPSPSFLSIRRVHVSLSRLCRVLEREERRCRYVSLQATMLQHIRHDYEKKWSGKSSLTTTTTSAVTTNAANGTTTTTTNNNSALNNTSNTATVTTTANASPVSVQGRKHHRRNSSFSMSFDRDAAIAASTHKDRKRDAVDDDSVVPSRENELVEIFLATQPPPQFPTGEEHLGNLARELVQVYNALARNDFRFPPTPSVLLTSRDGVVHINQHLAVAIESVAPARTLPMDTPVEIGPYHTLLFPHSSPSQLVETMSLAGAVAPRRLQQVLLMISPQKCLAEVAVDANLPLESTLEIAAHLVRHGACIVSQVVSRTTRLACPHVRRLAQVALRFSQTFGSEVSLFRVVHYLTNNTTLGEAMTALTTAGTHEVDEAGALRQALERLWLQRSVAREAGEETTYAPPAALADMRHLHTSNNNGTATSSNSHNNDLEDLLLQMAIWLCSHRVLVQEQEYLVAMALDDDTVDDHAADAEDQHTRDGVDPGEKKTDGSVRPDRITDDYYFRESWNDQCLMGTCTIQYCAWRLGLDVNRLRAIASRHPRLRIMTRVPNAENCVG
jgi:hypothetical protein